MSFWETLNTYVDTNIDNFVDTVITNLEKQSWYQSFIASTKCNLKKSLEAIDMISHMFPMYRIFDEKTDQTGWFKLNYFQYLMNFVPYIGNKSFSEYIWKLQIEERIVIFEYLTLMSQNMIIPENYSCDNCVSCKGCANCINCKNCYLCNKCIECESCRYSDKCEQSKLLDSCDYCFKCKQCTRSSECKECENCLECRINKQCKRSMKIVNCENVCNAYDLKKEKNLDAKKSFKIKITHNVIQTCGSCGKKICRSYMMLCCRRSVCFDCYTKAATRKIFVCPNCKHGHFIN